MDTKFFGTVMVAALILCSCVRDDTHLENPLNAGSENITVKIEQPESFPGSRAAGPLVGEGELVKVNNGTLYFVNSQTIITNSLKVIPPEDPAEGDNEETVRYDALSSTEGVTLKNINSRAVSVYFVGNSPSTLLPLPDSGSIDEVLKKLVALDSQADNVDWGINKASLYGKGTVEDGKVSFKISAVVARIQIPKLKKGGTITGFKVDGIFLNNFYHSTTIEGLPANGNLVSYDLSGPFEPNSDTGNPTYYDPEYEEIIYDWNPTDGLGSFDQSNPDEYLPKSAEGWVYNVFGGGIVPQVVFVLSDITGSDGTYYDDGQIVAVKGLIDAATGDPIASLENGRSYTFGEGLIIDENRLAAEDIGEVKAEIEQFFSLSLSGGDDLYNESKRIKIERIKEEADMVWDAWKNANDAFSEEKFISLGELYDGETGQFNIPSDLEPNAVMDYYWGTKGDKPADGYPLFVHLHGSGNRDSEWSSSYFLGMMFQDSPSVYFIPRIPNTGNYQPWYLKGKQYVYEKLLRLNLLSDDIDPNMIYFQGISEGGYGSQRLASYYADYLAGAGPMAGGEPLKNAPVENCRNTAFSLRTGANDDGYFRNRLTQYTKDEFDKWKSQFPESFTNFIEIIPGAGHSIDYYPTPVWLRQHKRNPYPKYVSWENFEMDHNYRNGFYNIYVNERSNSDESSRTYYEMEITGNNITLRVQNVVYTTIETSYGIELKFSKAYTTATTGKVTIYLCEELVDLEQEVILTVNGNEVFKGIVEPDRKHLVNSCMAFFDPMRVYPAAIEVEL